jgi:small subunit ribosomal protein S20
VAHSLSAKKRIRQTQKRSARNQARRSALKTRLCTAGRMIAAGKLEEAQQSLRQACAALDRSAAQGLIHRNAAARRKSRLARKLNALKQKAAATG